MKTITKKENTNTINILLLLENNKSLKKTNKKTTESPPVIATNMTMNFKSLIQEKKMRHTNVRIIFQMKKLATRYHARHYMYKKIHLCRHFGKTS